MSRRTALLFGVLLIGLLGPSGTASAQDTSVGGESRGAGEAQPQVASERTIFKQDANGQWRAVPLSEAFDDSRTRPSKPTADAPPIPDYYLSRLTLDGEITEAGAMMTADVTVKVITPDRWLKVPLRFDQALLLDVEHQHSGEGEAAPVFDRQPSEGIAWQFRGKGEHRLRLTFRVPLRKTPEGEQLQLQLPSLGYLIGKLELRVPSPSVTFQPGEGVRLINTVLKDNTTIATAELTGERLDLRWNVILQRAETMIQEPTDITLRLLDDLFELTARQKIQFREGQRKAIRVRYPSTDFELSPQGVRISDPSGTDLWVQPSGPDDLSWVTIPLDGVVGNVVELEWRLTRPAAEENTEITIDGFEVADTPRHIGTVTVESPADYRVSRIENGDVGIKRIDVNERSASLAYAFSGGQFRLKLLVEPVVPSLSVTPYYFLLVSPDRVELEAAFEVNVDGGSFRSVPIQLHEKEGTSWVVHASALTAGELRAVPGDSEQDRVRRWTLQLPEAVDRQTAVGISAAYFFGLYGSQDTTSFSLPTVTGARTYPGWLVVATADNVEVLTRPRAGTTLTRQDGSALSGRAITMPEWMQTQPQTIYRLSTKDQQTAPGLEADVTVRSQKTETSAVVEVSMSERELQVTQRITYNVEYGRISRIRLQIPPALAELAPEGFREDALEFSLNGETPLEEEWSKRNVSLDLRPPRLGEFEIVCRYPIARKLTSGEETLSVPIIRSLDQPYKKVRLWSPEPHGTALSVADDQWTRLVTVTDGPQWITDQPVESVDITLNRSLEQSPLRLTMSAALLQTEVDEVGHVSATATYVINRSIPQLVVQLPEHAENPRFAWNNTALTGAAAVEDPAIAQQFRLSPPMEDNASESRLTIRYSCPARSPEWSQSRTIDFPVFPDGVWIEETWWELTLPRSQHLFVSPATMTPEFQWRRNLAFWSRKTNRSYQDAKREILQESFLEPRPADESGNVYAFSSLGPIAEVRFSSLGTSMIVFLGAGLTLTISFLLVKVPAARHPSLWLLLGLVLTGASLWYLEPMLLLLQPAAYGLILPLCAALLEYATDGGYRRRRARPSDWGQWTPTGESGSGYLPPSGTDPQMTATPGRGSSISDAGMKS